MWILNGICMLSAQRSPFIVIPSRISLKLLQFIRDENIRIYFFCPAEENPIVAMHVSTWVNAYAWPRECLYSNRHAIYNIWYEPNSKGWQNWETKVIFTHTKKGMIWSNNKTKCATFILTHCNSCERENEKFHSWFFSDTLFKQLKNHWNRAQILFLFTLMNISSHKLLTMWYGILYSI